MSQVSVWTYRTVDLLLFHFNFLSSLIDTFLPLLLYLIILVLFICLFVFYHATKCAIACHSEWHHWRRHVSQHWWKKDVGQGVGRKSQGQVSYHTFSDIHCVSCRGLSYFCLSACVCLSPQDGWSNCAYWMHELERVPRTGLLLKTRLKDCLKFTSLSLTWEWSIMSNSCTWFISVLPMLVECLPHCWG